MTVAALAERLSTLYRAAMASETVYQDTLVAAYGAAASDARYDYRRNAATPMLAATRESFYAASNALHLAVLEFQAAEQTDMSISRYTFAQ